MRPDAADLLMLSPMALLCLRRGLAHEGFSLLVVCRFCRRQVVKAQQAPLASARLCRVVVFQVLSTTQTNSNANFKTLHSPPRSEENKSSPDVLCQRASGKALSQLMAAQKSDGGGLRKVREGPRRAAPLFLFRCPVILVRQIGVLASFASSAKGAISQPKPWSLHSPHQSTPASSRVLGVAIGLKTAVAPVILHQD